MPAAVTTYYLESKDPSEHRRKPARDDLQVVECEIPQPAFSRFLYRLVGDAWEWGDLDALDDAQWRARVEDPALRTWVAYHRGAVAGYFELHREGDDVEIRYFGMADGFIGQGFGGSLLSTAIDHAWAWPGARRVWVHTCNLDHPSALAHYQARGLQLYQTTVD